VYGAVFARRSIWSALSVTILSGLTACGGGSASASCQQPIREELDPAHLTHVIDPASARFLTDPPTSGPHVASALPSGVLFAAIPGAVQVALLEQGNVLVQHRDLAEADVAALEALVSNVVVVAPNPDLPEPVIATAWTYKLNCDAVDVAALESFIADHAGQELEH
jgi:hypothetical protein